MFRKPLYANIVPRRDAVRPRYRKVAIRSRLYVCTTGTSKRGEHID